MKKENACLRIGMENKKLSKVFRLKSYILPLCICILIAACNQTSTTTVATKTYFDVPGFFKEEITQLQKDSMIVIKTSSVNETSDVHQIDWTNWYRELILFINSDINKPAFIGKYAVDTIVQDSTSKIITYAATDSSLKTRLLEVTFNTATNSVFQIHIINNTKDFLSSTHEELYFLPMKAYVIKSSQTMLFFGTNEMKVMGKIRGREKKYF
ncbi:MAG: hypothetical protein LH473_08650 [Chitinophagales bacterium]|nr:hypothetical protein [Chitinophagales bacterium]